MPGLVGPNRQFPSTDERRSRSDRVKEIHQLPFIALDRNAVNLLDEELVGIDRGFAGTGKAQSAASNVGLDGAQKFVCLFLRRHVRALAHELCNLFVQVRNFVHFGLE